MLFHHSFKKFRPVIYRTSLLFCFSIFFSSVYFLLWENTVSILLASTEQACLFKDRTKSWYMLLNLTCRNYQILQQRCLVESFSLSLEQLGIFFLLIYFFCWVFSYFVVVLIWIFFSPSYLGYFKYIWFSREWQLPLLHRFST